ncbi:MAG: cellulase family glycosylhydrolase [Bacteroidales bacterium]|nr:cellulase family glycosylhydrolase [Bacteroidales bacterium]
MKEIRKKLLKIKNVSAMSYILMMLLIVVILFVASSQDLQSTNYDVKVRWSEEKANEWYAKQPWPCGFNYIPASAISYTEMWMPYCFNPDSIDMELALAEEIGFNCLRVVLPFIVWEYDPNAFKKRIETFLRICEKRGIKVMLTLFDDCTFGKDQKLKDPWYGKQPEVLKGWYANGWTPSPGHSMVREPNSWPRLEKYVKDIITLFKDDNRVWIWDLYNEPGLAGLRVDTASLVLKVFTWARESVPSQPLTIGVWNWNEKKLNAILCNHSDIITFHNYSNADSLTRVIDTLKKYNRPIINTEWLNRPEGSIVSTCLPVFQKENVGCMHWGLVNGKTQTHLHWGWRPGMGEPKVWQHDLFNNDHTAYDKKELILFRKYIGQNMKE